MPKFIQKLFLICILLSVNACDSRDSNPLNNAVSTSLTRNPNQHFQQLVDDYLQAYWPLHPTWAVYAGLYDFDTQLIAPSQQTRMQRRQLTEETLAALQNLDETVLSEKNKTDRLVLINNLRYDLWSDEVLQDWRWDPSNYNVAGGFGLILNTDYKPMPERLNAFYQRMANIPDYYRAAQDNIDHPTLPHLELAIQQNRGAVNLFKQQFLSLAEEAGTVQETMELYWVRADESVAAIEKHITYLNNLKNKLMQEGESFRDFRLGEDLFAEKFKRQIVTDFTASEVYQLAVQKKQALHDEMESITATLWPKYFPTTAMPEQRLDAIAMVITEVAKQHSARENFVDDVRRQIEILEKFVQEKDLLELDPTRPLVVREMPEYERGFSVASVDAPGPFSAQANTYYNVSPLDSYDEAGAESFLREYNSRTMQILNIHEAIPGHYAQLVHANKSNSLIKSLFGNGAMIEGWAVYAEHMMLEAGYGGGEPELRLMYNKWLLRTVVNTILDHDIHCNNLSEADALALMQNEGFQETAEATGKWRRATLSQVQLSSYFTGYSEILAFREAQKAELGERFNLKDFHHAFLSYGSAPVPIIKQLMREK